ncbi:MAG TPA: branched-chain amino acid ABC transporter permease [Myxococcales bacterium]|nr:branched-chain amino acid ABC transporter permease [Myxococcales bacterium]
MSQRVPVAIMVVLIVIAPWVIYPVFLMKALCFSLFACAFNLLLGYAGLLSFGHALFFGGASYATAHAALAWGWHPELALLFGIAVGAALGLVVGLIAIRRQGIYFAMITLALAQMFYFYCLRADFTGGENGIQGVPRGKLFGLVPLHMMTMYYVVAVIFLLGFALLHRTVHSPFGQVLKAIRENEPRAISLGYKADHYKLIAFVLSAALSAAAGGTKALVMQLASLTDVHWGTSGEVILMTLIGGMGTIFGPVAGAFIFAGMENYLSQLGSWVLVAEGAIFVVCVIAFRRGIFGELSRILKRPL